MWPARYWAQRYWPPRYRASGRAIAPVPASTMTLAPFTIVAQVIPGVAGAPDTLQLNVQVRGAH